jgi:glycosyltransferase involved in cell wall biosynthesis
MPDYHFTRIRRGEFKCDNPRCKRQFAHPVDHELIADYDIIFPQNADTIAMIPHTEKVVARIGGLDMRNPATERYSKDFERVAHIIATNQQLYEIASPANPRCTVIPNGVNLDLFKPRDPDAPNREGFMLGFAGNIMGGGADYKGWKYYVEACCRLAADGVVQKHLLHNVNQVAHKDMPAEFYHLIDALVLPSRGEGCSNVVSESLACGIPVLTTKVGYHGEMLEHEKNCLFIERDAVNIVENVRRLLTDSDLRTRLAVNGRKFAEEHHDVVKIAAMYDKIFKEILERRKE